MLFRSFVNGDRVGSKFFIWIILDLHIRSMSNTNYETGVLLANLDQN